MKPVTTTSLSPIPVPAVNDRGSFMFGPAAHMSAVGSYPKVELNASGDVPHTLWRNAVRSLPKDGVPPPMIQARPPTEPAAGS